MPYAGAPWFPLGTVLFSRGKSTYELVEDLGPGHHGERVLVALRRTHGDASGRVILKALPLPAVTSELKLARKRLEEEVKLASYLRHPNIARVFGMHKARGALYVITECVSGCSLNTLVEVALTHGRHFPESFMLYVGTQVAGALAHAHACQSEEGKPLNIVHRAIDPVRIRVTLAGEVKLMDFGIASARLPGQRTTRRPGARGEVYWASPEALLGQPEHARSDLFTLGMVLVELATGRHLLSAPTMLTEDLWELVPEGERERLGGAIARVQEEWGGVNPEDTVLRAATFTPADVDAATKGLSESTRAVFRKLLGRDPAERYPSALELQEGLSNVLRERGGYSAKNAADAIQAALRRAGEAMARDEDGARSAFCQDDITTEPTPA
ncbi:serine/threonine-protein kinase [Myxococcus faecalis]|uniref:serine/threonine protein kinase n=1 Tax=Myxococcus TaxID=32 RepID=UPI001CBCA5E5|nr:serine/threonine-protein kinase [Myxococcus sp. XM-1-1-1]MBZ4413731.1 serine/threonine protein kinase [Myxococcus sp. XM-1-1-1]